MSQHFLKIIAEVVLIVKFVKLVTTRLPIVAPPFKYGFTYEGLLKPSYRKNKT
jgi:hypothetical protein